MDAYELFSAGMRIIGLMAVGRGVYDLVYVIFFTLGADNISTAAKAPTADLIFGIFYTSAGLYLLRGAPLIMDFAFPYKHYDIEEIEQKATEDKLNSNRSNTED